MKRLFLHLITVSTKRVYAKVSFCFINARKNRAAIAEIIGTLLLILITVALAVVILAFSASGLAGQSSNFSNLVSNSQNSLSDNMVVEHVQFGTASYVPITISNSQISATASPFQQSVTINPSLYTNLEASDLGNIRFFSTLSSNTFSGPLDSWLEYVSSTPANAATSALFWLNLPNGIAASSSTTIYMTFLSTSSEFDGNVAGEAPQLSSTYGQYDNGANVFTLYGGASWSAFTFQSGTWTTANGYLQQTSSSASGGINGGPAALIESNTYPVTGSYVLETAFSYSGQTTPRVGIIADGTPVGAAGSGTADTMGYRFIGQQTNNGAGFVSFLNDLTAWVSNGAYQGTVSTAYTMQVIDAGGTWSGNLYGGYSIANTVLSSLGNTPYSTANSQGATSGFVGISAGYYTGSQVIANPTNVQWFRMRAYPPNGVMPTATSGSSSEGGANVANLYVRNDGSTQISVAAVYLQYASNNSLVTSVSYSPTITLNQGSYVELSIDYAYSSVSPYTFVIVAQDGSKVSINALA